MRRPPEITIRADERQAGRDAFAGGSLEFTLVRAATVAGYTVTESLSGGAAPSHEGSFPGSRWVQLTLRQPGVRTDRDIAEERVLRAGTGLYSLFRGDTFDYEIASDRINEWNASLAHAAQSGVEPNVAVMGTGNGIGRILVAWINDDIDPVASELHPLLDRWRSLAPATVAGDVGGSKPPSLVDTWSREVADDGAAPASPVWAPPSFPPPTAPGHPG